MEDEGMNMQEKVKGYLEYCEYRKLLDEKTLKAYRIDLRQYFSFLNQSEPEKEILEEYIIDLHKKYKQKTVKRKLASVKAFYNYLEEEEIVEENPFRKIRMKFKESIILPRIIPRNEIEQLLNYIYTHPIMENEEKHICWLRDLAVIEMLFATGARVYEISNISIDCVDLVSGTIRFMGKGGKERYVQIGENSILRLLKKYYHANKGAIRQSGFFFVNRRGYRFTEQSIRLMLRKYTRLAGIDRNITPHGRVIIRTS